MRFQRLLPLLVLWAAVGVCHAAQTLIAPTPTDWVQVISDFKSEDVAKQAAAEQKLLEAGSRGHTELAALLNAPQAALAQRAKALREKIDQQSYKRYGDAMAIRQKIENEPLTVDALKDMHKKWLEVAAYASQQAIKQNCFQLAQQAQQMVQYVEQTQRDLVAIDAQIKNTPAEQSLMRAALQVNRANGLNSLHRFDEAIAAAQAVGGMVSKECRHALSAQRLLIEMYMQRQNHRDAEAVCQSLLQDYPRSLESKFAQQTLNEICTLNGRWEEAVQRTKAFLMAFPIDEGAQDQAFSLIESLKDDKEFDRCGALADWLCQTLSSERLTCDVVSEAARWAEYVKHDYATAQKYQALLLKLFADEKDAELLKASTQRLNAKAEGKFPKAPAETDAGPAGALARYVTAVRQRDAKLLEAIVPKALFAELKEELPMSELPATLTYGDLVLKEAKVDEAKKEATLVLEYYDPESAEPMALEQKAIEEDGQWKIRWVDQQPEHQDGDGHEH